MWFDEKSVEGRKDEKVKEIKERSHSASEDIEKEWSPIVWGLMQPWRAAWVRASKREEKNREGKRKYTVRKRAASEKKKRVKRELFFTQVVSLSIVISI